MKQIYLDANGSSIPITCAKEKIIHVLDVIGNPSSFHYHGRKARQILDEARQNVALALNVPTKSVIFTSGASESNRLFLDALLKKAQAENKKLKVLCSIFEHPSLIKPLLNLLDTPFFAIDFIKTNENDPLAFRHLAVEEYDVIICTQAHNETGITPDLQGLFSKASPHAIVMSDISQGFSRMELAPQRADVLVCSAQKMGGFAGCGAVVVQNNAASLPAPYQGGGQEKGFRPGSENLMLIAAFGEAAKNIDTTKKAYEKITTMRDYFEAEISSKVTCKILGKNAPRLCNTSAITFLNQNPEALRIKMDLAGLSVGYGSACSGLAPEGSFALKHMGLTIPEQKTTVRFSFDHSFLYDDINEVIQRLLKNVL